MSASSPPESLDGRHSSPARTAGTIALVVVVAFALFYLAAYDSGYHISTNEVALRRGVLSCGESSSGNSSCSHLTTLSASVTEANGTTVANIEMFFISSQFPSGNSAAEDSQLYFASSIYPQSGLEVESVDMYVHEGFLCPSCANNFQWLYIPSSDCLPSVGQCPGVNSASFVENHYFELSEPYGWGIADFVLTFPAGESGCFSCIANPFNFTVTWTFTLAPSFKGGDFFSPLTDYVGTVTIPFDASSNYTLSLGS